MYLGWDEEPYIDGKTKRRNNSDRYCRNYMGKFLEPKALINISKGARRSPSR